MTETVEMGGRKIAAFATLQENSTRNLVSIQPIPVDGNHGYSTDMQGGYLIEIWGVETDVGKAIAKKYEEREFPTDEQPSWDEIFNEEDNDE